MAINQISAIPKDIRTLHHARILLPATPASDHHDDQPSPRKVKLLCSFGGQIIPRPSDGLLRYAGGDTRLITVRRDATLPEIIHKMDEVLGMPAAIRYQLPDVDLDALVSVSSPEDLDNMMEEYDKIVETAPDGSAKLRVFLFPRPDLPPAAADPVAQIMLDDTALRYVDAVNGIGTNAAADGIKEGTSPTIISPTDSNFNDQSGLFFVGVPTPVGSPESPCLPANPLTTGSTDPAQTINPSRQELSQPPYAPQAYVDPNQVQYINPQSFGTPAGSLPNNVVAIAPHPYNPSAMVSQVGSVKSVLAKVDSCLEENLYGGRAAQLHSDPYNKAAYHPLSQLPPLPPTYLQPQYVDRYGLGPVVPPLSQGLTVRIEDCYMCQKGLLHAHSDTLLQRNGNGFGSAAPEASVVSHILHSEDSMRSRAPNRIINGPLAESILEPKTENMIAAGQFGPFGFAQIPETRRENEKLVLPNAESSNIAKVTRPPAGTGLPSATQLSHGMFVNIPHSQCDSLQQQLPQCLGQSHAHSDTLLQENGNGSGSAAPEASSVFHGLHPEDEMRLRAPNRMINEPLTESMVEPKTENTIAAGHFGPYGFAQIPETRYDNERLALPNTESSDHAKVLRPPAAAMGLPTMPSITQLSHGLPAAMGLSTMPSATQLSHGPLAVMGLPSATQLSHGPPTVMGLPSATQLSCGPPAEIGLPSATQLSHEMLVNIPHSHCEDSLQQQLPHCSGQPQLLVKPDGITTPYGNDVYPVKNINGQAAEHLSRGSVLESSYDYDRSIDGMMEALHVTPFENSGYNEKWKPIVATSNLGTLTDLKPVNPPVVENNHPVRPHGGGNTVLVSNAFIKPVIIPEGNYVRRADLLLPSSVGFTQLQNLQPAVPSNLSTSREYLFNKKTGYNLMVPNDRLHGVPAYSCGIDPLHNNSTVNNIPIGDLKDQVSRYLKDMTNDLGGTPSGNVPCTFPSSTGTNGHAELFQEQVHLDPLFCNQDSRKILGNTNLLPPRHPRVTSKESVIPRDFTSEDILVSNEVPDVAVLIEEGVFHQPPNSLNKDSCPDPPGRSTRGDEQIKQELQALAEGVAASVLQSSITSAPIFVAHDTKEPTPQSYKEKGTTEDIASSHSAAALGDHRIEDIKTKQVDKANLGFPTGDEIGRLQIIKNSDLEELRELGSGTFGTVYHGKWRGSDVAIKRINDRCFAGKPSEQDRMRADFWNEACKLADLHHPNVVAFYGVVLDGPGGSVATVTEYMSNGSLRDVLHKDRTLDHRKRLLIAMDVAFGMEYLHGKNIVHFDLKSDNLLVNLRDPQRPICKVGDLGLSKVKCHTLISGGVRGTLPWMAPELLNGSSSLVSEKVDVFSFGIVMWELLTGEEPYADLHFGVIIGGIVNNTLRPLVPESCGSDWRSLMEKCWSAEASERPSFTEIAGRLRAMAASLPSKGR